MGNTVNRHIAFFLPSLNIGGIGRVFITYANYFVSNSHHVDFVLCKRQGELLSLLNPDVKIHELNGVDLRYSFYLLRKYIIKYSPEYIFTGGDYSNFVTILSSIALKKKPQIIISQHNYFNIESKRLGWWSNLTCFLMKFLYPRSHQIIAISDGIYKFLNNDIGIPHKKLIKISNPIDLNEIRLKSEVELNVQLPQNYIVYIGRLSYVKNLPFLLSSFEKANLKGFSLVIVGAGEMIDVLKEQKNKMKKGAFVHFMGAMDNPLPILKKSKLLVLPSFSEAYPTILLEALSLNIPILATPTNGAIDILDNIPGTCVADSYDDINLFANLLEKSVNNKIDAKIAKNKLYLNSIEVIYKEFQTKIFNKYEHCT